MVCQSLQLPESGSASSTIEGVPCTGVVTVLLRVGGRGPCRTLESPSWGNSSILLLDFCIFHISTVDFLVSILFFDVLVMLFFIVVILIFKLLHNVSLLLEEAPETAQFRPRFQDLREKEEKTAEQLTGLGLRHLKKSDHYQQLPGKVLKFT